MIVETKLVGPAEESTESVTETAVPGRLGNPPDIPGPTTETEPERIKRKPRALLSALAVLDVRKIASEIVAHVPDRADALNLREPVAPLLVKLPIRNVKGRTIRKKKDVKVPGPALLGLGGGEVTGDTRESPEDLRPEPPEILVEPTSVPHILGIRESDKKPNLTLIGTYKPLEALARLPDTPHIIRARGVPLHKAHVLFGVKKVLPVPVHIGNTNVRPEKLPRLKVHKILKTANLATAGDTRSKTTLNPTPRPLLPHKTALVRIIFITWLTELRERNIPRNVDARAVVEPGIVAALDFLPFLTGTDKRNLRGGNLVSRDTAVPVITRKGLVVT
ncbi:hypothetical protein [Fibrobacter sp.]|uniref:hypothetical protein n=1 Tax=Fibrobacter sp. TaxID=35828 RepID=UPI00386E2CDE